MAKPSVTFELDGDSSFVLDTALGEFAQRMRQRAADEFPAPEWAVRMAHIAEDFRKRTNDAFGTGEPPHD